MRTMEELLEELEGMSSDGSTVVNLAWVIRKLQLIYELSQ